MVRTWLGTLARLASALVPHPSRKNTRRESPRLGIEPLEARALFDVGGAASRVLQTAGPGPLAFQASTDQTDSPVRFLMRGDGYSLSVAPTETVLSLLRPLTPGAVPAPSASGGALSLRLVNANAAASLTGLDPLEATGQSFVAGAPAQSVTDLSAFSRIEAHDVYRGIDLAYYGNVQGQLEYDFIVHPGADPTAIGMHFNSASVQLDAQGNLIIHGAGGDLVEQAPVLYQTLDGVRHEVSGRFVVQADGQAGFAVGAYDPTQTLVIDPVVTVTSTADSGAGTLRDAINQVNAPSGPTAIAFNIPTTDAGYHGSTQRFTIQPLSALPAITRPVVLDATTQPGYSTHPVIELKGSAIPQGTYADGLDVTAGSTTIMGLAINQFTGILNNATGGVGIRLTANGSNRIVADYLGTDATGTVAEGNTYAGVFITSANNTVGGTTAADRDVISGGNDRGVYIGGLTAHGNLVEGDYLGTTADGLHALGNASYGVRLDNPANNTIGGLTSTPGTGAGNVISANGPTNGSGTGNGISIIGSNATGNLVQGNVIGLGADGVTVLGGQEVGVSTGSSASANTIGGTAASARNLISGNQIGVDLSWNGNVVQGNYVGTDVSGTLARGNTVIGIELLPQGAGTPTQNNLIGGTSAGAGNVISGNGLYGVWLTGATVTGNLVEGNFIGTNAAGTAALPNSGDGVRINTGASRNTVGGTTAAARNVISGNATRGNPYAGVDLADSGTTGNLIVGNYVGTDVSGTQALGNGWSGVRIGAGASGNTVGGTAAGAGNVLSGNVSDGADLSGTGNLVEGNLIGTDASGLHALGNNVSMNFSGGGGVVIWTGGVNNTIGGTAAGAGNVIAGNSYAGVNLNSGASNNLVAGNFIGTDITGLHALDNGNGVVLFGGGFATSANTLGGTAAGAGNLISGNNGDGIVLTDGYTPGTVIVGNTIGLGADGVTALGNAASGVELDNASGVVIGASAGGRNVIAANDLDGIRVSGGSGHVIQGNYLGTDAAGTAALANGGDGVRINGSANIIVGGAVAGAGNVISGNGGNGIVISGAGSTGNLIAGNAIGTDRTGTAALGNAQVGVLMDSGAANNTVGGTATGARNVISGNADHGVFINDVGSNDNLIAGNYIGTDATGLVVLGNGGHGVFIWNGAGNTVGGTSAAAGNVIGGNLAGVFVTDAGATGNVVADDYLGVGSDGKTPVPNAYGAEFQNTAGQNFLGLPGAGNVISANDTAGVALSSAGDIVQGNLIGTDASGTVGLGGQIYGGLWAFGGAQGDTIGGAAAGAGNVISGNDATGLVLDGSYSVVSGNVILGNWIGTAADGVTAVSNAASGVLIVNSANNVLGGTGAGAANVIADNRGPGIQVGGNTGDTGATGNVIRGNSIHGNATVGIDLGNDGVTANDALGHTGPNDLQDFPLITAVLPGQSTVLQGTVTGQAGATVTIDLYTSTVAEASGNAEGANYLTSVAVTLDAAGNGSFDLSLPVLIRPGTFVTATATDAGGNTSEFSAGWTVASAHRPTVTIDGIPANGGQEGTPVTLTSAVIDFNTGAQVSYAWTAYKNGVPFTSGSDSDFTFTPDGPGAYAATLQVTDSVGGVSITSVSFTAASIAPTVTVSTVTGPNQTAPGIPASATWNTPIQLTSTVAAQGAAETFTYAWTVTRDGQTVALPGGTTTGPSFNFTPAANGLYVVSLTVTDSGGASATDAGAIVVTGGPETSDLAPTVTIQGNGQVALGSPISLTGAVAGASTGPGFTYVWAMTRDNAPVTLPPGTVTTASTFTFTPAASGVYQVTLTATDNNGGQSTSRFAVDVQPVTRTLTLTGLPTTLDPTTQLPVSPEGTAVNLTAPVKNAGSVQFTDTWAVSRNGVPFASGTTTDGMAFAFTPNDSGTYLVTVTAAGADGSSVAATATILASDVPPTVSIKNAGASEVVEGTAVSFTSIVSDVGPANTFQYHWVVTLNGSDLDLAGALAQSPTFSFTPVVHGTYTVSLTVTDDGGDSTTATQSVTVDHVPPVVQIVSDPNNPSTSAQVNLASRVSEPNPNEAYTSYTWTVTNNGQQVATGTGPNVGFARADGGTYVVTLSVTDNDTATGSATTSIVMLAQGATLDLTAADLAQHSQVNVFAQGDDTVSASGILVDPSKPLPTVVLTAVGGGNTLIGGPTVNILYGDSGSNTLIGGSGPNTLFGTGGDLLEGGSGSNQFNITPGNEQVIAGPGLNNTLSFASSAGPVSFTLGQAGAQAIDASGDKLAVTGNVQQLFGSANGNDSLAVVGASNVSLFGGNHSTLSGSNASNVSLFGGSNTSLSGNNLSNATLFGGSGANVSASGGNNVTLFGGAGANVSANGGNNVSLFGSGSANLSGTNLSNATLFGGGGANVSASGGNNVSLFGGAGANVSASGGNNVSLFGGTGASLTGTNLSNATLFGGSGANVSTSGGNNVSLFGGNNSTVSGSNANNVTLFGSAGATLTGTNLSNATLFGGTGANISANGGNNVSLFGGNNASLTGTNLSNATLFGGSGANVSASGGSNVTLFGGANASLTGTNLNNASLFGGSGANVSASGGNNVSLFGGSNSTVSGSNANNVTLFGGSNASLTGTNLNNATLFGGSGANVSASGGNNVSLFGGDNARLTGNGLANASLFGGNNSTLSGANGNNVTLFGGSNASLTGTNLNNATLFGGSGANVSANGGNNVSLFGGNNSTLSGSNANNVTLFGGNNASLTGNNLNNATLFGGNGANVSASGGNNVSLFGGDNARLTGDSLSGATLFGGNNSTLSGSNGNNVTLFGGNNASVTGNNLTGATLFGGTGAALSADHSSNVSLFGGSGGSVLETTESDNALLFGGAGNDTLTATGGSNVTLFGGAGNDSLTVTGGTNVSLFGGDGDNALNSSGGTNVSLFGGAGNDTLTSNGGANVSLFGGGGNDSLSTQAGTNVSLYGGAGSDTLLAGGGANVSLFGGDGNDSLVATGGSNVNLFGGAGDDTLSATGGQQLPAVTLFGEDGNNTYTIDGGSGQAFAVTLNKVVTAGGDTSTTDAVSQGSDTITFSNLSGIHLDLSQTGAQRLTASSAQDIEVTLAGSFQGVVGTAGNDWIHGNASNNSLVGGDGSDTLIAGSGNATLEGGAGDDSLVGGTGNTTYRFAGANLGSDVIAQPLSTQQDTLDLGGLTGAATVSIDVSATAPQAVNANLTLTLTNPLGIANVILGTSTGDAFTGNSRDNQITVGPGNDTLTGGGGHDAYLFTAGSLGSDTITDTYVLGAANTSTDTLNFQQMTAPVTLDLSQAVDAATHQLTQAVSPGVLSLTLNDPNAFANVVGSPYADNIKGSGRDGALIGAGGGDVLQAGGGNVLVEGNLTQVVLLNFDTDTNAALQHVYTTDERAAIQARLQTIYAAFNYAFTTSASQAQALAAPTGGQFVTLFFNGGPDGGASNDLDFRNLNLGGSATINVNNLLGGTAQPAATSADFVALSAEIAAHELGHLSGLRHEDAFGPIGSGVYGATAATYLPVYTGPADATETPLHVMASPDSVGTTLFDSVGATFFGEREAVKLAFADTGAVTAEQVAPHQTLTQAQALALAPLAVPNTEAPGSQDYGKAFIVTAADVTGSIGIDPTTGDSEDDYYSFTLSQATVVNLEVMSNSLTRIANPIDSVLRLYDGQGKLLAVNDDEFESQDSVLFDQALVAGIYYVEVDTYTPDAATVPHNDAQDADTGSYELFVYTFNTASAATTPPAADGDTLLAGAGNDTLVGSSGNDVFNLAGATAASRVVLVTGSGSPTVNQGQTAVLFSEASGSNFFVSTTLTVTDAGGAYTGATYAASGSVLGADGTRLGTPSFTYYTLDASGNVLGAGSASAPAGVGSYEVVASFAGSAGYLPASAAATFTINPVTPTLTVTDAGGTYTGSTFAATASVTSVSGGSAASLEAVNPTFTYYAGTSATGTPLGAAPSAAGTYTVVASFAGSADYTPASAQATFTIGKATPAVSVNDAGGIYNGSTFAAAAGMAGANGGSAASLEAVSPTVSYYAGGTPLAGAPSAAGTYTVVASFAGSADYAAASAQATFVIAKATPAVSVSAVGGTYTGSAFAATAGVAGVSGGPAANLEAVSPTVTYYTGTSASGTPLGAAPSAAGTYTVVASFAGSADYTPASAQATFTIGKATPAVSVSDAGGIYNGSTFAAVTTVAGASSLENVSPTLTYFTGAGTGGSLLAGAPTTVGTYTVAATFAGSADYAGASCCVTFTICQAASTVAVTPSTTATVFGQSVTFTVTVGVVAPGAGTPMGSVAILDGGTVLGTATLAVVNGIDQTTFTTSALITGTHPITVSYTGDANFLAGSTPQALTQIINPDATTTAVVSSAANGSMNFGQRLTVTATVAANLPGGGTLTGGVDFIDTITGNDLGTVALSAGSATLNTTVLPSGSQTIKALYLGDGNFSASTNSATVRVVPSVYVLNTTTAGALNLSGNGQVKVAGLLVVDSNSTTAITASGNALATAASIQVVGGASTSGNARLSPAPVKVAFTADPFAGLAAPGVTNSQGSVSLSGNSALTINPGVYTQISVSGNSRLTLNPGIYVLAGGGFTATGNAIVTGSGVLLYNAGSNYLSGPGGNFGGVALSGNAQVNLTAATAGPYAGIVLFQACANTRALSFSGNALAGLNGGLIYAPAALLTLSSNGSVNSTPLIVSQLQITGNGANALDASADSTTDVAGQLLAGDLVIYVDNSLGTLTPDEMARLADAIATTNALLVPYSVRISQTADSSLANEVLNMDTSSAAGSYADGVLGSESPGEITLVQGWDWYAGSDATAVGANQYDFETAVVHEIGHALGLGHSTDPASAMYATLTTGQAKRALVTADFGIPDTDGGPCALHAAPATLAPAFRLTADLLGDTVMHPGAALLLGQAGLLTDDTATTPATLPFADVLRTGLAEGQTAAPALQGEPARQDHSRLADALAEVFSQGWDRGADAFTS